MRENNFSESKNRRENTFDIENSKTYIFLILFTDSLDFFILFHTVHWLVKTHYALIITKKITIIIKKSINKHVLTIN